MSYITPPGAQPFGCFITSPNTGPTLSNTTVKTKFPFNSIVYDPFSMFDDANDRIVIPTGTPSYRYMVWGYHECGGNAAGLRTNEIRVNGSASSSFPETVIASAGGVVNTRFPYGPVMINMSGDDYIESWVAQNSGSNETWQRGAMYLLRMVEAG